MAFPTTPTNGSIATVNGITYVYSTASTSWTRLQASNSSGVFSVTTNTYTADGATITYTLSVTPTSADVIFVNIGGVLQQESAYTIVGNQITFTGVPLTGTIIEIRTFSATKIGVISGVTYNTYTGDGSTTTYTLSVSPANSNYVMAYVNGVGQPKNSYSISTGGQFIFNAAPPVATPSIYAMTDDGTDTIITVTTTAPHGAVPGCQILISGVTIATGSAPNGTFTVFNVINATQFTFNASTILSGTLNIGSANLTIYPLIEVTVFGPAVSTAFATGSNNQVQFNNSGIMGASANFTFTNSSNTLYADNLTGLAANIGNLTVTGNIVGNLTTVSGTTTLSNLSVTGNTTTNNITVTNNITSSSIAITNSANLGAATSIKITGGSANYVLTTDGAGNLSWKAGPTPQAQGANTQIQYNNNSALAGSSTFTFNSSSNLVSATAFAGDGGNLSNIQGANVNGYVPTATTALSIPGGNVIGAVAVAGTVSASAQPNITSVGTLTISNLKITGGTSGQAIVTDGTGNLSFGSVASGGGGGGSASANLAIGYSLIFGG